MASRMGLVPFLVFAWCTLSANDGLAVMQKGYVQKITDGDTIWFNTRKDFDVDTRLKIRMLHIDAPETHLPTSNGIVNQGHWGDAATKKLMSLLEIEQKVVLDNQGTDKYERTLGVVYDGDTDVNLKMVESGWAIPYIICSGSTCNKSFIKTERVAEYVAACEDARANGKGIWDPADPLEEMPFEFRLRHQERDPDKYVGDYKTKALVEPDAYPKIDVCRRVFFMKKSEAVRAGFKEAR